MNVLVINCGSSSLKFQLINSDSEKCIAKGLCERIGIDGSQISYTPAGGDKETKVTPMPDHTEAIRLVLEALTNPKTGVVKSLDEIDAVGHRIVHGGEKFAQSTVIDDEVMKAIEECNDLAPLHNPANLIGINACKKLMPNTPMVAVFDTSFHQTMPEEAYMYGLPYEYYKKYKVRRYGFHGTSHSYASLSFYITEDAKPSFWDFLAEHTWVVLAVSGAILLVILGLMIRSIYAERKAARLISATETDQLTGLYNRDYFLQYAARMRREHPETPMDAAVLNIDRFHSVNALNGRGFGDLVLKTLAKELHAVAEESGGIAGRFGADRFDLYCPHREDYQELYDRLQGCLDALAPAAGIRLRMGVMPWQEGMEAVQMFDRARTACSMARDSYGEHLIVFDSKMQERENYEQRLLNDLNRALSSYEFEVYYQPQYDIQCDPPKLVSAEALVRWNHPELGLIPPNDFVPLFERHGKIGEVDRFVWSEAARQIARWRDLYGVTIPVSVNLSRVDVFDPALESALDRLMAYNGLGQGTLKLEVTESAYTGNADQVIKVVESLRRKGYVVEMDDFGSGYSSLNMLSAMPVDVLKMDRAFIRKIGEGEKDTHLIALILGLAKSLKVPVVAEGVETKDQLELLRKLGCPLVQGYYFSRPLPAAEFEKTVIRNMQSEEKKTAP